MSSYIEIRNVVKSFGSNTVLKHINLDVNEGEMVTLLGPSGCGKSTLLRAIAGLNDVDEGSVFIDGRDVTHVDVRQRQVGMVFQSYALFPNMTAAQNVAFGLSIKKLPKEEIQQKVSAMIELVGLKGKENQRPSQLSGGQQQRVALARALVMEPKVLGPASGRAALRTGCPDPSEPARADSRDPAGHAHHRHLRHPRSGGGHGHLRPRMRDARRRNRPGGRARDAL